MASGAPAFDVPPDLQGAGELRAWFTDPPGSVVQLAKACRGTKEMAEWLIGPGYLRLRGRFPDATNLTLVIDLSLMESRDPAARALLIEKARELGGRFARVFIVPPVKTNPIYLTTLHAAAALLNAIGRDVVIAKSLDAVVAEAKLKPAPPVGA